MKYVSHVFLLLSYLLVGVTQAAEKSYDITTCFQGEVTLVAKSDALTVFSVESNGIARSNDSDKTFEGSSAHCVGIGKVEPHGSVRQGYCKYLESNGDVVVGEFNQVNKENGTWKYLSGTGTSAGIVGGGAYETLVRGKPMRPGTYSSCSRATGRYTLP